VKKLRIHNYFYYKNKNRKRKLLRKRRRLRAKIWAIYRRRNWVLKRKKYIILKYLVPNRLYVLRRKLISRSLFKFYKSYKFFKYLKLIYKNLKLDYFVYKNLKHFSFQKKFFFELKRFKKWHSFLRVIIKNKLRKSYFKRKIAKFGVVRITRSQNNMFFAIHDRRKKLVYASSVGALGLKPTKIRFGYDSLTKAADKIARKLQSFKLYYIVIHCRFKAYYGFRQFIWALKKNKLKIRYILDFNRVPHNGLRLSARRRVAARH
jgi:ribosomal protein S11